LVRGRRSSDARTSEALSLFSPAGERQFVESSLHLFFLECLPPPPSPDPPFSLPPGAQAILFARNEKNAFFSPFVEVFLHLGPSSCFSSAQFFFTAALPSEAPRSSRMGDERLSFPQYSSS